MFLDGIGGTGPEMDPLTCAWTLPLSQREAPPPWAAPPTENATFVVNREGLYVVQFEVSDFIGPGTPDTVALAATTA